ncbi:MAG: phosphatase PAP2 family protein [Candidatus Rokuibacteriota bacterium]
MLALTVLLFDPLRGDAAARLWVLGFASPAVVQVARGVNYLGSWHALLPGALLVFVVFPKARACWWIWAAAMLAAPAAEQLLKALIARARPEEASMGFPSGHATAAATFFGIVIYLAGSLPPRLRVAVRVVSIALMVIVALARVILRAHWPVDTLAGIALGLVLASAASLLADAPTARTGRERAEDEPRIRRRAG